MPRVSNETIERVVAFFDSLPEESRNKCAYCSETLTHIVKMAEVQTGAGTATVTRVLSERINEVVVPGDRVSGEALRQRLRYHEGLKGQNDQITTDKPRDTIATKWTGDQEGYTPEIYINSARIVMGGIYVDPASNEYANQIVKAGCFFTKENDGLKESWNGNVFLNPPYSQPEINHFIEKLLDEYSSGNTKQAILLTNNNTDTKWFHSSINKSSAVCFTKGRINFYKPDGSITHPTNGQAFFYFGNNTILFVKEFNKHGVILTKFE